LRYPFFFPFLFGPCRKTLEINNYRLTFSPSSQIFFPVSQDFFFSDDHFGHFLRRLFLFLSPPTTNTPLFRSLVLFFLPSPPRNPKPAFFFGRLVVRLYEVGFNAVGCFSSSAPRNRPPEPFRYRSTPLWAQLFLPPPRNNVDPTFVVGTHSG